MSPTPLIRTDELAAALLQEPAPSVLDVRWSLGGPPGLAAFRQGHLQRACFVDLDHDLAAAAGPAGRHPLPDPAVFEAAMRRCGVHERRPVVVYDAGGGLSAARAWWLLRHHGHSDVRLLDGGLAAWTAASLPITRQQPTPEAGDFRALPGSMAVLDTAEVLEFARTGVLLDARAAERYRGETEPIDPVAGHIPGARSAPTAGNLDSDGLMLPADVLRRQFARAGVGAEVAVAAYCGSGVTAAHEVLALEVAGIHAALYPGSWSEWVADPSRPVATGPERG